MNNKIENCLLVLMEECAEVQKICSKIIRFGFDSYHPDDLEKKVNIIKLAEEYGDLLGTFDKLEDLVFPDRYDKDYEEFLNFCTITGVNRRSKPERINKFYKISQRIKNENY